MTKRDSYTYSFDMDHGKRSDGAPYHYVPSRGIRFSREEYKHLLLAMVVLTVAFTLMLRYQRQPSSIGDYLLIVVTAVTATFTGFLFHELMHKYFAQKYGAWAEFRSSKFGLMFALVTSLFGFLFAAPGAVYISGALGRKENGTVSLAGPMTNNAFSTLFLILALVSQGSPLLFGYFAYVSFLDAWLGLFNMIPVPPLDGSKVLMWSKRAFATGLIIPAALIGILAIMNVGL
jgi:Zn-dependent protease